jgi:HTH-type transcriptional regulator, sugar sensing transcriptional regulator
MPDEHHAAALAFGFSDLEARLYVALVQHGQQTGYGAAKLVKKPAANCYKALESLSEKGAVLASPGNTVLFSAVQPLELAQTFSSAYQAKVQEAATSLSRLVCADATGDVFRIADAQKGLEKARHVLSTAREIVLVDIFPNALATLVPAINEATRRGLRVFVKCYGGSEVEATRVIRTPNANIILERWPGEWVVIVADGNEVLMLLLEKNLQSMIQGIWTKSPYLSWLYHYSLASELELTSLQSLAHADPQMPLKKALSASSIDAANVTAYKNLQHS